MKHDCQSTPFDTLLPALHRRARRLTGNPERAADLAQEAALKVWQAVQDGAEIDALHPYAMTALRNLARSDWRGQRMVEELTEDHASTPHEAPARLACAELRQALANLPAPQARLMAFVAEGETRAC